MKRDENILKARLAGKTLQEIGNEFGLTRERVRQIIKDAGGVNNENSRKQRYANRLISIRNQIDTEWSRLSVLTTGEVLNEFKITKTELRQILSIPKMLELECNQPVSVELQTWSDKRCLDAIKDAATYEYPISTKRYGELVELGVIDGPSVPLIFKRFRSWKAACELAGVESGATVRPEYTSNWSDEDLYTLIWAFMKSHKQELWTLNRFENWLKKQSNAPSFPLLRMRVIQNWPCTKLKVWLWNESKNGN